MLLYKHESSDSLSRFVVLTAPLVGGMLIVVPLQLLSWQWLLALAVLWLLVVAGLRSSITVSEHETVIDKKWFFLTYRRYRAPVIDDVWYGGDWGLADGALGVVVKLNQKEIHLGTSKTMHELYDRLRPLSQAYKRTLG